MSKQIEALKLALEALKELRMLGMNMQWHDSWLAKSETAITAIREALADSALDRMAENARELGLDYEPPCKTGSQCTNKCQQCEQPAQKREPKRWAVFCSECRKEWSVSYPHPGKSICAECDAKAGAQQQEPVAIKTLSKIGKAVGYWRADLVPPHIREDSHEITPLYTSPQPSKPWVGLTLGDMYEIGEFKNTHGYVPTGFKRLATAIEEKLKEKNA